MSSSSERLKEIINTLRNISTGVLDDALALLGINGSIMGVRPMRGFEDAKIVGPAVTILFSPPVRKIRYFPIIKSCRNPIREASL